MNPVIKDKQVNARSSTHSSAVVNPKEPKALYHNCDSTTIRLRHEYDEKLTCSFYACMEADARDTS